MAISVMVGDNVFPLGSAQFVHCFFSTISFYCEPDGMGTRLTNLTGTLCEGELPWRQSGQALLELKYAHAALMTRQATELIWDVDNLQAAPPWDRNDISPKRASLGHYFITAEGVTLYHCFARALHLSAQQQIPVWLE